MYENENFESKKLKKKNIVNFVWIIGVKEHEFWRIRKIITENLWRLREIGRD